MKLQRPEAIPENAWKFLSPVFGLDGREIEPVQWGRYILATDGHVMAIYADGPRASVDELRAGGYEGTAIPLWPKRRMELVSGGWTMAAAPVLGVDVAHDAINHAVSIPFTIDWRYARGFVQHYVVTLTECVSRASVLAACKVAAEEHVTSAEQVRFLEEDAEWKDKLEALRLKLKTLQQEHRDGKALRRGAIEHVRDEMRKHRSYRKNPPPVGLGLEKIVGLGTVERPYVQVPFLRAALKAIDAETVRITWTDPQSPVILSDANSNDSSVWIVMPMRR